MVDYLSTMDRAESTIVELQVRVGVGLGLVWGRFEVALRFPESPDSIFKVSRVAGLDF